MINLIIFIFTTLYVIWKNLARILIHCAHTFRCFQTLFKRHLQILTDLCLIWTLFYYQAPLNLENRCFKSLNHYTVINATRRKKVVKLIANNFYINTWSNIYTIYLSYSASVNAFGPPTMPVDQGRPQRRAKGAIAPLGIVRNYLWFYITSINYNTILNKRVFKKC